MRYIVIALAKGRLADLSIELFEKIGINCSMLKEKTRKLIFTNEELKLKFILVKPTDVATYVEHGAADIGVVGSDVLMEQRANLYEMVNLGFGACKMSVAGPEKLRGKISRINNLRVATKFPEIAKDYFQFKKGQTIDIIKLNGSIELAPIVGLSDVIVDIVESGKTLKENGLEVLEDITEISARLVVNRVSMKTETDRILDIVNKIRKII